MDIKQYINDFTLIDTAIDVVHSNLGFFLVLSIVAFVLCVIGLLVTRK